MFVNFYISSEDISDDCEDDSGEYKCQLCPKSFQWKANLIRHQVIDYVYIVRLQFLFHGYGNYIIIIFFI